MIIPNGTIEFIKNTGGGLDSNGYPVAPTVKYGCPIPCQYTPNNHNYLAESNGEAYTKASYSILVEHLKPCKKTERLRLKDKWGRTVREFSVLEFEPLDAVSQVRIIV